MVNGLAMAGEGGRGRGIDRPDLYLCGAHQALIPGVQFDGRNISSISPVSLEAVLGTTVAGPHPVAKRKSRSHRA